MSVMHIPFGRADKQKLRNWSITYPTVRVLDRSSPERFTQFLARKQLTVNAHADVRAVERKNSHFTDVEV